MVRRSIAASGEEGRDLLAAIVTELATQVHAERSFENMRGLRRRVEVGEAARGLLACADCGSDPCASTAVASARNGYDVEGEQISGHIVSKEHTAC